MVSRALWQLDKPSQEPRLQEGAWAGNHLTCISGWISGLSGDWHGRRSQLELDEHRGLSGRELAQRVLNPDFSTQFRGKERAREAVG